MKPHQQCLGGLVVLLMLACLAGAAAGGQEVHGGGAATRGFYSWGIVGGYAVTPQLPVDFGVLEGVGRVDGFLAFRDNVTSITLSLVPTLRWTPPGFAGQQFQPYVAAGAGAHLQGAWSDLHEFGGVQTRAKWVAKWHAYFGATLVRGRLADLVVETRYTAPSDLTFDYLAFAVRWRGEL